MSRKPAIVVDSRGNASIRETVPRPIFLLLKEVATRLQIPEAAAYRFFLSEIAGMVEAGQVGFLGSTWVSALKAVREENFGALSPGLPIDLSQLHRSTKTKSGFVGVYANGRGFRAMAKMKGSEIYIGQFETAEEAAWKRRLYYKENKLPYGELEVDIAAWRARGEQGTDEELARAILEHAKSVGTLHVYAGSLDGTPAYMAPEQAKEPGMKGISSEAMERLLGGDS